MLCAHTVRRLKPGKFDEFVSGFGPPDDAAPQGWVRFNVLRDLNDPDQVVTFGFCLMTVGKVAGWSGPPKSTWSVIIACADCCSAT